MTGIPLFFYAVLRANKEMLREPCIKAQLGFLYAGYREEYWWWEMVRLLLSACACC